MAQPNMNVQLAETAIRTLPEPPLPADVILAATPALLLLVDQSGVIRYSSPSAERYGLQAHQLVGRRLVDLAEPDQRGVLVRMVIAAVSNPNAAARGRLRLRSTNGEHVLSASVCCGAAAGAYLLLQGWDVSDEEAELRQLREQAFTDPLTGLANRHLFTDRLKLELHRRQRTGRELAVLFGDVDGLKDTNDRHGHAAGDAVLSEIARRIASQLRPSDTAARLGGDEFAIICPDLIEANYAPALVRRLTGAMSEPAMISGGAVSLRVSFGMALAEADDHLDGGRSLLARADREMYRHKRRASEVDTPPARA